MVNATVYPLSEVASDNPIPLLYRKRVFGERMLLAQVHLKAGCHVALHHHENEQVAYVVRGKVRWILGEPGTSEHREVVAGEDTVIHLPSHFPHAVHAMEDTLIIDLLSPPGEMGIDRQSSEN